jgi:hypothetical protein
MARISNDDLKKAMGQQSQNRLSKQEEEGGDLVLYTIFGKHDLLDGNSNPLTDNEKVAFAKKQKNGKSYQYFVKGDGAGRLLNPLGLFSAYERKYDSTKGKMIFKFVRCDKKVFDYYVSFLRTQNSAWLKHAEREL